MKESSIGRTLRDAWKYDPDKPDQRRWKQVFAAGECKKKTQEKAQVTTYLSKMMQVPGAGSAICFSLYNNILQVFVGTPSAVFSTTPLHRLASLENQKLFDHFFPQSRMKEGA